MNCHALEKFHSNANLYAQIWLGLGADIVCVIAVLNLIKKYFDQPSNQETDAIELRNEKKTKTKIRNHNIYIFGMLLSQGGPCLSKRLQIRLVAGVWCLATFLFVQAYSSVLFTYVVAPKQRCYGTVNEDSKKTIQIHVALKCLSTFDRSNQDQETFTLK
uniref:Ionotropic glutamate receptor C-terminal domain-containing protein n=1 Tax=Daphnia galeata TaxID=27404 RepID=A0A8J2WVL8_9CRUS|nr:unnamed protein product [Daphnia galeata]